MSGAAARAISALRRELLEIDLAGSRSHHCSRVALAVTLAVVVALVLRVDAPWWAAISAFVSTQATAPASLRRGALRIVGTAIGAAAGLLLSPWLIEDQVALSLALFVASSIGVLGLQVSLHGYAWLLGAVTCDMVLLATLDDPTSALSVACNRTAEVTIGTLAAILVSHLLSPRENHAPPRPQAPGWSDLLGAQWASTQHAMHAGLGVMLVPLAWSWLQLPNFSQAAITVAAVMAVPVLSDDDAANRESITARGTHRILGCLIGGLAGLAVLVVSFENFLPWLAALAIGVWIGAHVQASARDIGYVGTQGAVVFIMTMVQGSGPPSSIIPGIDRLAGITGGLLIVQIVAILLAPSAARVAAR
ncbi:putative membrane protein YccC [Bradyrhizobium japonicum USDA 38]|uniref:FUSC family protein n=1 Tax=Bradyrhizobium japonicum TaxID=375 RepID=UPI0009B7DDE4|nr:FUSC family protein [Bradyrhizobium japonicum]MCS3900007.1 putative membrane protein YccC [Bradyrhizobium japonicum USDA 38]MCS3943061.1 putative membrane protein YccC [Bradyrhizobium japonicum]MCW2224237.1 putative membrane protein YccC [Bradyrhizobium japonicum]MCW2339479.1 putative membrane protein YccC [Bradyrhizobium japonicum]